MAPVSGTFNGVITFTPCLSLHEVDVKSIQCGLTHREISDVKNPNL
jgi:hypothetical protein